MYTLQLSFHSNLRIYTLNACIYNMAINVYYVVLLCCMIDMLIRSLQLAD